MIKWNNTRNKIMYLSLVNFFFVCLNWISFIETNVYGCEEESFFCLWYLCVYSPNLSLICLKRAVININHLVKWCSSRLLYCMRLRTIYVYCNLCKFIASVVSAILKRLLVLWAGLLWLRNEICLMFILLWKRRGGV